MLRGAYKVLYSVGSGDVLVRNCIRNRRCFSDAFKGVKGSGYTKPKNMTRLKVDFQDKKRIAELTARIKSLQARLQELEKKGQTEKSKLVRAKLVLILKDLDNALRDIRRLIK